MRWLTQLAVGLIITVAPLLLLTACRNGGDSGGMKLQPTGQLGATATLQSVVQPPARPAEFASYPAAVGGRGAP